METAIMSAMCRCCASEGVFKDVKSSYTWMGDEEVYADMLRECFDIHLSTSEHCEDGGICEVCITQLRNASNFKKQVLHTEEQFKKHINNKLFKPSIVKVEVSAEEDNDSDDNNMSAEEAYSGPEFEIPIKTETEEPKPKKRAASSKATTSRAKKAKGDSGESSSKRPGWGTREIRIERPTKSTVELKFISKRSTGDDPSVNVPVLESTKHKNWLNLMHILRNSNANPIRCKDSIGYGCTFCPKKFPKPRALKKHFLAEHNNDKLTKCTSWKMLEYVIKLDITHLNCSLCDKDIANLDDFISHLKNQHGKEMFEDAKNNIVPFIFDTPELKCAICSTEFGGFKLLQEHMNTHFRNFICDVCDAGFVTDRLRKSHRMRHGTGEFRCDRCNKAFDSPRKRREHQKTAHLGLNARNKCTICSERFVDYWKKRTHMVKEHGAPPVVLECSACDRTFDNQRALSLHTKKDHLLQREHKCSECDSSFFLKSSLKRHMAKHNGLRQFQCDICLKAYARKSTLMRHMRIHNNDRRFACKHCSQAFVQKCSWRIHMRSKHGEIV